MPRTAVTLAKTHEGEWKLLSNPDVSIVEQLKNFRAILGKKSHEDFSIVQMQESDGYVRRVNLRSPQDQEQHDKLRADELNKAKEAGKLQAAADAKRKGKEQEARNKADAAEIEKLSEQALSNPNRGGKAAEQDPSTAETKTKTKNK